MQYHVSIYENKANHIESDKEALRLCSLIQLRVERLEKALVPLEPTISTSACTNLCDLPEDILYLIIEEVAKVITYTECTGYGFKSIQALRLSVGFAPLSSRLTKLSSVNRYFALLCAKEIFEHCAIGRSMVMAAQEPPPITLRYARYLTIYRHSLSHKVLIPWIFSERLVGLRCEGGLSETYWDTLNKSLPACMVNLVHLSLNINGWNTSSETSEAFHSAMAKLSRSVREISLDLLGWTREVSFALSIIQRDFGDLRSIRLKHLTHDVQGRVLTGQYWSCKNQLEELSLQLSDFSMRDLLDFLDQMPNIKKVTVCQCLNVDVSSPDKDDRHQRLVQIHRC